MAIKSACVIAHFAIVVQSSQSELSALIQVRLQSEYIDVKDVLLDPKTLDGPLRTVLKHMRPDSDLCDCDKVEFDQYAICKSDITNAKSALSFGIRHYDVWGQYLNDNFDLVPNTFDCYDTKAPTTFANNFSAVCVGDAAVEKEGRPYNTMNALLDGSEPGQALVKMDIEGDEFNILEQIDTKDLLRMGSFSIEYHVPKIHSPPYRSCPTEEDLTRMEMILKKVGQGLAVVSATANYYQPDCFDGSGVLVPDFVAVSYASRASCKKGI